MDEVVVKVDGVSKNFKLPQEKTGSVKSVFTNLFGYLKNRRKFQTQHALNDISFDIKKGEFFGIVGRNGSGKSTLLKILAGIYQPTKGSVHTEGKLVPFIELGVGFNPELTGRQNVYLNGAMLGFSEEEIEAQYKDIVDFAELEEFMDQKLKNYSSGMQVRLAFSMAIRAEADILLVDEVLAVGDAAFKRKCYEYFRKLKKDKKTVVFVSHDMEAVRQYCDRAAFIEKNRLEMLGDTQKIADAYTKLFIREAQRDIDKQKGGKGTAVDTRWGDAAIKYVSTDYKADTKGLTIQATVKAYQDIEDPVFGFLVKNYNGQVILGTNSQKKKLKLPDMKKGQTKTITWQLSNIFNEGRYNVDLAISYNQGVSADWWEDAMVVDIVTEENNAFLVNPDASFDIKETAKNGQKA